MSTPFQCFGVDKNLENNIIANISQLYFIFLPVISCCWCQTAKY